MLRPYRAGTQSKIVNRKSSILTLSLAFILVTILALLIVGISKSGFGGGLGVVAVPMMSIFMPPAQAAALLLPILCVMDLFAVWHYRRMWDARNLRILLPAAMVGLLVGALTFRYLSEDHVRVLIGVIAVTFAANFFRPSHRITRTEANVVRGSFWGLISGFTSFGVHAGGPPASVYLLPQRLDKSVFVGTTVVFFTIVNFVKLVPYGLLGQLNGDNLLTSLLFSPLAPLGIWLGVVLHKRLNEQLFYTICYAFLFLTGLKLLYDGLV